MKVIDSKVSKKFLELASKELTGDWVVIGGTVMILMGISERVTVDIDLAGPETATQADTLRLMTLAEKVGLAPEAINQAGAFFLRKISGWRKNLVEITRTQNFSLSRPNAFLFIQLKASRLSESDLADCLNMLKVEKLSGVQSKDLKAILSKISKDSKKSLDYRLRCNQLLKALS